MSNTGTTITVDHAFDVTPDATSQYMVCYDLEDIYLADVAGSWGNFNKLGNRQYQMTRNTVQVGDATTQTGLGIIAAQLTLENGGFLTVQHPALYCRIASLLQIGYVVDETKKISKHGLQFFSHSIQGNTIMAGSANSAPDMGEFYVYSSHFIARGFDINGSSYFGILARIIDETKQRLWNTDFIGTFIAYSRNTYKVRIFGSSHSVNTCRGNMDEIYAAGGLRGFSWYQTGGITIRNPIARGNTYTLRSSAITDHITVIDADFDTWTILWESTTTKTFIRQYSQNFSTVDGAGAALGSVRLAVYNNAAAEVFNVTTDGTSGVAAEQLVSMGYYNQTNGDTIQSYNNHTFKARKYGYQYIQQTRTIDAKVVEKLGMSTNPYTVANLATASAYTGISVNGETKVITVSGTRTIQELYDYMQWWGAESTNIQYTEALTTANGVTFTLGSGWTISVTGSLSSITQTISGTVNVTSGGFFEGVDGAKWDVTGTTYFGSHFYTNVKALTGGVNLQNAVVAYFNAAGADVTYNTSRVVGGILTDASGNAEGYVVWKIGSTVDSAITQYIGEYNYQWSSIPKTVAGGQIGTTGAYETVRLTTDSQVTLTKTNALLVSGITVAQASTNVDLATNTLTAAYDNLKARQATTSAIEGIIKGYTNYVSYGLLISKDATTYTLKTAWEFDNHSTSETGTFRGGRISFSTPVTCDEKFYDNTLDFEAVGTYDLRTATITGTVTLVNTSGGNVTVLLHPAHTYTNTGPNITVTASVAITISVAGLVAGSRVQLYDVTNATELSNAIVAGTSTSLTYTYSTPTTIRLRVKLTSSTTAYKWFETTGTTSTAGLSFTANQTVDGVYATNGINGSTVTECSISGTTVRLYIDDPDNTTTWQRVYNWYQYYLFTEAGIREQSGDYFYTLGDAAYYYTSATASFKIKNSDLSNPLAITGAVVTPSSGSATDIIDATGGTIVANTAHATVVTGEGGGGGATAEEVRIEMDNNSVKLNAALTTDEFMGLGD